MLYLQIGGAMLLDLVFGDPRWYPHPVRFIGWLCNRAESIFRNLSVPLPMRVRGMLASLFVILVTILSGLIILALLGSLHEGAGVVGSIILLYVSLSTGDLVAHSNSVRNGLEKELATGRKKVGRMVGRDTDNLDEPGVVRACVESVAENLVDGTTAVLFWAFVAGLFGTLLGYPTVGAAALGAICYKAVNTLDSMHGYRNERYELFGWFAANLDDWANFVPARVSAVCVIMSAFLLGYDGRGAARVCAADRLKHSSPNSGHTEAAMAGALGIELGGPACYFGQEVVKPRLGESLRTPRLQDIGRANRLAITSSVLFYTVCSLCYLILLELMIS